MLKRISFKVIHLRTLLFGLLGLVSLSVLAGSLFYVNYQAVRQTTASRQAFNWVLAGKVIAVDPGHGGYDPGAKGVGGTLEKDLNLIIAARLREVLQQAGAVVVMTREQDVDLLSPGEGTMKLRDLNNRLKLIEEAGAELLISIHLNSSGSTWRGAQVFYHPKHPDNKELATFIQAELRSQLQNTKRQALPLTAPYLLKELEIPAVIVEAGFISNPAEEALLQERDYQIRLGQAVTAGIYQYLFNR